MATALKCLNEVCLTLTDAVTGDKTLSKGRVLSLAQGITGACEVASETVAEALACQDIALWQAQSSKDPLKRMKPLKVLVTKPPADDGGCGVPDYGEGPLVRHAGVWRLGEGREKEVPEGRE